MVIAFTVVLIKVNIWMFDTCESNNRVSVDVWCARCDRFCDVN